MRYALVAVAAAITLAAAPSAARAQDSSAMIRPGMNEQDVRERWGEPAAVRRSNEWTFMFYSNGMNRAIGWYDVVFLQNNAVVDCIARGEGHVYTGQSSAPPGRMPEPTLPPARPEGGSP